MSDGDLGGQGATSAAANPSTRSLRGLDALNFCLADVRDGLGPSLAIYLIAVPLVAGLFVLVEALDRTGVIRLMSEQLREAVSAGPREAAAGGGALVAFGSNLVNNLPAGLVAGSAVQSADVPRHVAGAILIGIDLGPNLSVTGSLATILWLAALRREGQRVGTWQFLKPGALVMPPALILAIVGLLLTV